MAAPLLAAAPAVPQSPRGLDEQARQGVRVARVSVTESLVVGVEYADVVRVARVHSIGVRNQPRRLERVPAVRAVQGSQNQPPSGQTVLADGSWGCPAVVRAAADPISGPFIDRLVLWRRPPAVALEP